ncbi:xaa-Pro aminopeptidase 3-like [Anneissia japonica]|uniref:xaa-Pro aminopeptidase 3-like n=1 Tax=Anneissia japonica TaxID=1529436 RepID=UPI0014258F58|nr:xaa-Pro aminopeptidase 3-like [Anneissia japonica]
MGIEKMFSKRFINLIRHYKGTASNINSSNAKINCKSFSSAANIEIPERNLGQPTPFAHKHLMAHDDITPGISRSEFKQRRNALMTSISRSASGSESKHHIVVVLSSEKKFMTDEIPYPFRQSTNFLYLSGFQEPDSALVLESLPGKVLQHHKSVLFVPDRDPDRELWDGPRAGTEGAKRFLCVDETYSINEFSKALENYSRLDDVTIWYDVFKNVHPNLHDKVISGLINPSRRKGNSISILEHSMHSLRVLKSDAEIRLLRESASIAARSFVKVMKASYPGIREAELYAKIDFECRVAGAEFLAYPPVVAGGNRANILHYINNNQVVNDNELVLMDAGCEYHGYASDVTRTWPVNGRYTTPQGELYELVLRIQKNCIHMCREGATLDQAYHQMLTWIGEGLQHLGIISDKLNHMELYKVAKCYCPHHLGHYLGMDTHDTTKVSRSNQLQPGMVVTIEPGIYIPEHDSSAPERYRGIGIRIEDDVLITDSKAEVLSDECPKEIAEIEAIVNQS